MDLIFAASGAGAGRALGRVVATATRVAGHEPVVHTSDGSATTIGWAGRSAGLVGSAANRHRRLVALGSFWTPLARCAGAPTDRDAAARWLVDRHAAGSDGFLDGLPGEYVVAVAVADRLDVATSGGGHHKWYEVAVDGGWVLSTNLLVAAAALDDPGIDRSYEDFLLGYEFLPDRRTIVGGCRFLPLGTVVGYPALDGPRRDVESPGERAAPVTAWDPDEAWAGGGSEDAGTLVDDLYERFMGALEDCASADREQAVLLGGFDSALVASGLHRMGRSVETFTFSFDDPRYVQPHVDTLEAYLGHRHTWVPISPEVIADGLSRWATVFSAPSNQPHNLVQTLHTVRTVAESGYATCLNGDGCDGAFLGYPSVHARAKLVERLGRFLPGPMVTAALAATSPAVLERWLGQPWRLGRGLLENQSRPWPDRGLLGNQVLGPLSLARVRPDRPVQAESPDQVVARLAAPFRETDRLRLAYAGSALTGQSKMKVEGSSSAAGVAQASPYNHPLVRGFARRLPVDMLRPDGGSSDGKYILTRMAVEKGLLPEPIVDQPKMSPVSSPVDQWYRDALRSTVLDMVGGLPFEADARFVADLLRPKRAEDLYRDRLSLGDYTSNALGLLATYGVLCSAVRTGDPLPLGVG